MPEIMDVIEFLDDSGSVMVQRIPDSGNAEINWGSQLTVRESQAAVFFRDGKSLDVFGPGRHVLQTQNIPVLTKLITSLGYGTDSPFRSEVYFISKKLFNNLKWGTKTPILFKDKDFQMIRLRAFGSFSIQIEDPALFLNKVVGTSGYYNDYDIEEYLRTIILTKFTDMLGENVESIFSLPEQFNELSIISRNMLLEEFKGLGLTVHDFQISSISPPKEVQEMIDARSSMAAIGDMDKFFKYKAALSMQAAAENTSDGSGAGTGASAGMGIGAGMGMGMMYPQMFANMNNDSTSKESSIDKLKKLKELHDMGIINDDEYSEKKNKLLSEI